MTSHATVDPGAPGQNGLEHRPRRINPLLRPNPSRHVNVTVRCYREYGPAPCKRPHQTTGSGRAPRPDLCAGTKTRRLSPDAQARSPFPEETAIRLHSRTDPSQRPLQSRGAPREIPRHPDPNQAASTPRPRLKVVYTNTFHRTSDIVHSFGRQLSELEKTVRRMLLESLGVVNHFDRQNSELTFSFRMAKYGSLTSQEATVVLPPHVDETTVTLVVQHKVAGLQVLTADGEWLAAPPSPNYSSLIQPAGRRRKDTTCDGFSCVPQGWSNGRLHAKLHRVLVGGGETRYSAIFGSHPKDDVMVQVPEELVDEEHPLIYKPFDYLSYVNFRHSEEGVKSDDSLKAYCGVQVDKVGA
ncbi:hypothetical protein C4D60_Mb05t08120 [Musa balbisiana]|uniref:Fe2OG dioxygenase domain-containing protein n=1 Tax=Musa balbisiana TaxID=52838 RepID=A0A4S8JUK7_MUSBA|nr:hypothetical protein C4D60_Mb05t08120 [Musa balbisiana]